MTFVAAEPFRPCSTSKETQSPSLVRQDLIDCIYNNHCLKRRQEDEKDTWIEGRGIRRTKW